MEEGSILSRSCIWTGKVLLIEEDFSIKMMYHFIGMEGREEREQVENMLSDLNSRPAL